MGFLEILTIIFVVLKLLSVIEWSWWLVFSPMYVAVALYAFVLTFQIIMWKRAKNTHDKFMGDFWEDK